MLASIALGKRLSIGKKVRCTCAGATHFALLVRDIHRVVRKQPLLPRLDAEQHIQAGDILWHGDLGGPFRRLAGAGHRHGRQIGAFPVIDGRRAFLDAAGQAAALWLRLIALIYEHLLAEGITPREC